MKNTNPKKVVAKINSTVEFAVLLNNLDRAVRDINKIQLTNRQKSIVSQVYKGY